MRLERKFEAALIRELAVERWEMEAVDEEKPLTTGKVHAANWTGALDAVVFHYDRNAIDIERRRLHGVRLRRRARVKRSGRPFLLSVALYEKGDYRCRRCSMTVATRSASAGSPPASQHPFERHPGGAGDREFVLLPAPDRAVAGDQQRPGDRRLRQPERLAAVVKEGGFAHRFNAGLRVDFRYWQEMRPLPYVQDCGPTSGAG